MDGEALADARLGAALRERFTRGRVVHVGEGPALLAREDQPLGQANVLLLRSRARSSRRTCASSGASGTTRALPVLVVSSLPFHWARTTRMTPAVSSRSSQRSAVASPTRSPV
jgi:hypothetical protein